MQRSNEYACSFAGSTSPNFAVAHNTSSAFSASANPNEDWTKISDLAERRRIQNRIAQRNYRKKIKRKLEDYERRASSPDESPEHIHMDLAPSHRPAQRTEVQAKRTKSKNTKGSRSGRQPPSRHPATQHPHDVDDYSTLFPLQQPMRDLSTSPQPQLSYSYPHPEPMVSAPYGQSSTFHNVPVCFPEYQGQSYYLPPLPTTLPSMPSYDLEPMKPENHFDDGALNHMSHHMPYTAYGGLEIPHVQPYQDSNVHTPPLSHSHSFEYSRAGSPTLYPSTPISGSISPRLVVRST